MSVRISHTTIYVLDQERAKAFYTEKLGFEVHDDVRMGNFRWLTVAPRDQADVLLILMPLDESSPMDAETVTTLRQLVEAGKLGAAVLETKDCRKTYEELSARGVVFRGPPVERPYGIEAILRDDSNNWFSLTQRR